MSAGLTSGFGVTRIVPDLKRLSAIFLLLSVTALGTGALRFVHELEHALHGHAHADDAGRETPPSHDESSCAIHALLKLPMLPGAWLPLLVCLGLFVAFLSMLSPPPLRSRRLLLVFDPRGPPVARPLQTV